MEITMSGLLDTVLASDEIVLTKTGRQTSLGRTVTVEYNDAANRLRTDVHVRGCFDGAQSKVVRDAVWDTGAVSTTIDESLARSIGLQPIDKGKMVAIGGVVESNIYMVDVIVALGMEVRNIKAYGIDLSAREMKLVLGMDVISQGRLTIDSLSGETRMEFTLPEKK